MTSARRLIACATTVAASVGLAALSTQSASAASYTLITAYAGAGTTTGVIGINNAGYMTGAIQYSDGSGPAFLRDPAGLYTLFSNAGAFQSEGRGINSSNELTGFSGDVSATIQTFTEFKRDSGGAITVLINPTDGTPLHGIVQGINASGEIVGSHWFTSGGHKFQHGYILNGASFTDLSVGPLFSDRTAARGITDAGVVVGWDNNLVSGLAQSWVYSGGAFQFVIDPRPGNVGTFLAAINNNGMASGLWQDAALNSHPFLYNTLTHAFTELHPPGGGSFSALGINDLGEAVLNGVTASGATVNYLYNPLGVPEPATWTLMLIGFCGLGSALRGRRRKQAAQVAA